MKIVLIGATGTIGAAVADLLEQNHQVVRVGSRGGDYQVDLGSKSSIEALLTQVGAVDAVVSTAGVAKFGPLSELSDEDFELGLVNKLMGQVNLVRLGLKHVRDEGSITLSSGLMARQPMPGSASVSLVNGALDSFVKAAALETERGVRINAVSPVFVKETMQAMGMDSATGLSAAHTAKAYMAAVEGADQGQVLDVRDYE